MNKVCEYCGDDWSKPIYHKDGTKAFLLGRATLSVIRECPMGVTDIPIKFCPMCGRKLEEGK